MKTQNIAGLKCLVHEGAPGQGCIVLLHGYGASMNDLAPLAEYMSVKGNPTWVFPDGPLSVPLGPMMSGRAWFPIDVQELEKAMLEGRSRDYSQRRPAGMDRAQSLLVSFLSEVSSRYPKVVLGGFSQGAMMTVDVAPELELKPLGLLLLSGTLVCEKQWRDKLSELEGLPFFQSHGKSDPVLGFEAAEELEKLLDSKGLNGALHSFSGGHEIPPKILGAAKKWLEGLLGS